MTDTPLATVAILTFNGEKYLDRLLTAVLEQDVDGPFDILVIDSGSTDSTLEITRRFPTVRLHEIPNSEFGHGKTRNLAAQLATGEFVAFLTHDAIPTNNQWLRQMLLPFELNSKIVAVTGQQIPRKDCFPLLKFEISGLFGNFGSPAGTTLYLDDPTVLPKHRYLVTFYSDVNAVSRRSFLINEIAYRDVPYAEDQMFGTDIIEAGYIKAYASRGSVEHSNDLTLQEYRKRIFDETVGLRRIGAEIDPIGLSHTLRAIAFGIIGDSYRILRDKDYHPLRKLYWLFANPQYQVDKWLSYRKATTVDLDDHAAISARSLEHSRKRA